MESALLDLKTITPLPDPGDVPVARAVQAHLRRLVLSGTLPAGTEFSQVTLARALGVSRTPLREALRMLQEEGLIEAEPHRQARVTAFDAGELDTIYSVRVTLESLAAAMTATAPPSELVAEIDELIVSMEARSAEGDEDEFARLHRLFHRRIVSAAPEPVERVIASYQLRSERYTRMLVSGESAPHVARDREHREIAEAIATGDPARTSHALADHLARTALTLMVQMAPSRDAPAVRTALAMVCGQLPAR